MKKLFTLLLFLICFTAKAQIFTQNLFGTGNPNGIVRAASQIKFIDISSRTRWKQITIPNGTYWTVDSQNAIVTLNYLSGIIPISQGGTGQTTAPAALNALLPSQTGNSGKVLGTNGTTPAWVSSGGGSGTVTSIGTTAPITGGTITTTGTIGITQSGVATNGYLSSADWNTFNNKGNGTVTSVGTGYGLSGGAITTSGTIIADTSCSTCPASKTYVNNLNGNFVPYTGATTNVTLGSNSLTSDVTILAGAVGGLYTGSAGSGVGGIGFNSTPDGGYLAGVTGYGALMQLAPSTGTFSMFLESNVAGGLPHGHTTTLEWDNTGKVRFPVGVLLGTLNTALGNIGFYGSTSGLVTVQPKAIAGTWSLTLPDGDGNNLDFLQTDGNGITSWVAGNSGTVTSVSGTTNRITSTGGATPVIDISATYDALWQPKDADLTAIAGITVARGALIVGDSGPSWARLALGSAGKVLRSDGTDLLYSTSTFADTYTASNILYSNGANTVTGLATANNGVLITNSSGVPSISTTARVYTICGATLSTATIAVSPADNTTYYYGGRVEPLTTRTTSGISRIYIDYAGTVTACRVVYNQAAGSNETSTLNLRLNNTSDIVVSNAITNDATTTTFTNTGLSQAVAANDYLEFKWVTPAGGWTSNPTVVGMQWTIYVRPD